MHLVNGQWMMWHLMKNWNLSSHNRIPPSHFDGSISDIALTMVYNQLFDLLQIRNESLNKDHWSNLWHKNHEFTTNYSITKLFEWKLLTSKHILWLKDGLLSACKLQTNACQLNRFVYSALIQIFDFIRFNRRTILILNYGTIQGLYTTEKKHTTNAL